MGQGLDKGVQLDSQLGLTLTETGHWVLPSPGMELEKHTLTLTLTFY